MTDPSQRRALHSPAIVVGLGAFGTSVAQRLVEERERELALVWGDAPVVGHELAAICVPSLGANDSNDDPDTLSGRVIAAARQALAHERLVPLRDEAGLEQPGRLVILVCAHFEEPAVREHLQSVLAAVERRLLTELGPIFESFRRGSRRNGVVLPLLAMPHPPAFAQGTDVIDAVRSLVEAVASTPHDRRAIPNVYLIEDVAELTVLSEADLSQCTRNFAQLVLGTRLRSDELEAILYTSQPEEPLASFVCAVAELSRTKLAAYGIDRVALEVVDAVCRAPRRDSTLAEIDALEEIEVASYRSDAEAEADVRAVLERYCPPIAPDAPLQWWERGAVLAQRYGPDPGDPSVIEPAAPVDPPEGWALERMRRIEEAWRLLQRKRFDDVVERDRTQIESWRDALLDRLRRRVDRELWEDPSPVSIRRTEALVDNLSRAFREQLDQAIGERDACRPADPPAFVSFRGAHARCLDAARAKPDPDRMLLWGVLGWFAIGLFLAPVLRLFAEAIRLDEGSWYAPLLREYASWTAFGLGLLVLGGFLGHVLGRAHLRVLEGLRDMWKALDDTVTGPRGSLLEYFTSRLHLSRAIARVEALLSVSAALEADRERLLLIDKAARKAVTRLRDDLRALGVVVRPEGDDLGAMLGRDGSLVESFVAAAGASEIAHALPPESKEGRTHAVLASLADHYGRSNRWREELPFTSLPRLRAAAEPHAEPIVSWDPLAGAERAQATAEHLAGFVRRQVRSLRGALNFTGYEDLDSTGIDRPFLDGQALVPRGAAELVRERLQDDAVRARVRPIDDHDRAYYVMIATGIDLRAVASLRQVGTADASAPPRTSKEAPPEGVPRRPRLLDPSALTASPDDTPAKKV
jgi:hypothetical protein